MGFWWKSEDSPQDCRQAEGPTRSLLCEVWEAQEAASSGSSLSLLLPLCHYRSPVPRAWPFSEPIQGALGEQWTVALCQSALTSPGPSHAPEQGRVTLVTLWAVLQAPWQGRRQGCSILFIFEAFISSISTGDVRNAPEERSGSIQFNSSDMYEYLPCMRCHLDPGKETEVTKRRSLPLGCLKSEVEETDVYIVDNHSVLPSPKEVEL